ncbi:MAG: hypothetical protein EPN45_07990 [Rhizobiaceae bacterium]|nr:MAG: hypothetical protein EPN45_07990 [Rhizobiaceae bacterium]
MTFTKPLWETDPFRFLINQKFPALIAYADEELRRISPELENCYCEAERLSHAYFLDLCAMDSAALHALLAEEKAKVIKQHIETTMLLDSRRFFNESFAEADLDHWSKISYWTTDEAVALSLGKDPRIVTWDTIEDYAAQSVFVFVFAERQELIRRAIEAGQLRERNTPPFFLAWALRTRFYMPVPLVEAVSILGNQIADWKTEYDRLVAFVNDQSQRTEATKAELEQQREAAFDALLSLNNDYVELMQKHEVMEQELIACREGGNANSTPAKTMHAKERESLLKMIIGMALKGYGHDPRVSRSGTAKEIASDLAIAGLPLDEDTVRKYLNKAKQLLPGDETEQNR